MVLTTCPRCQLCNKKTLIGIDCSCGLYFCLCHRHPEDHKCKNHEKFIISEKQKLLNNTILHSIEETKIEKI